MSLSNAVGADRRTRTSGYKISKGFFNETSTNLPQQILILGVPNSANKDTVDYNKSIEIISAKEAGEMFGYGSPIHQAMRILRPVTGGGVQGIPTFVLPLENSGEAKEVKLTITGTVVKAGTHSLVINGRDGIDGFKYAYSVTTDSTVTTIAKSISDAVNGCISSPFLASAALGVVTLKTKYVGVVSNDCTVSVDSGKYESVGITYAITEDKAGVGNSSLAVFNTFLGEDWITTILNTEDSAHFKDFERVNGYCGPENPSGRYTPEIFKPFMAFTGCNGSKVKLTEYKDATTDAEQVTNVICPAPTTLASNSEISANYVRLFCRLVQDSPHLDISGMVLPDLPIAKDPSDIMFTSLDQRDWYVKNGISTVLFSKGQFIVNDFVTTYRVTGETPPQFSYARNMNLDWNIKDYYMTLERLNLRDKVIISDKQVASVKGTIKVKEWKAIVFSMFNALAADALIKDIDFSKSTLKVEVDSVNKDRFNTFFCYRRTGISRIQSTDVEAGF